MVAFKSCICELEHLIIKDHLKLHYSWKEFHLLIMAKSGIKLLKIKCTHIEKQKVEDHVNFLLQEKW